MSTVRIARFELCAFALGTVIPLASACSDGTAPLQREGRPAALEFSMNGFSAQTRELELRGDTIVARRTPPGLVPGQPSDSVRVVPSADAWRAFWVAVDEAGVRRWLPRYVADGIVDGNGWGLRLRLVSAGADISSGGSNAYPDRLGCEHELEVTAEFQSLTSAMNVLAGVPNWF